MMVDCDNAQEDEWPNADEANDIMLAYGATEGNHGSSSGCVGSILILIGILIATSLVSRSVDFDSSISGALRSVNLLVETPQPVD